MMNEKQAAEQKAMKEQEQKPAKAPKTKGVFKIVNKKTKSEFFGASSQIEVVFKDYMKWLENGKHSNKKLQEEYDKHGKDAFELVIIEKLPGTAGRKELMEAKAKYMPQPEQPEKVEKAEKK